jgi:hypothetical protein
LEKSKFIFIFKALEEKNHATVISVQASLTYGKIVFGDRVPLRYNAVDHFRITWQFFSRWNKVKEGKSSPQVLPSTAK